MVSNRLTLGTRGSELALAQTRLVEIALRDAWRDVEIQVEIIRTSGDQNTGSFQPEDTKAGRKGMFTRELEKELLRGRIDVAVHSAKDLPSELLSDLEIRAVLPRGDVRDVLITRQAHDLAALPDKGIIATGSVRRQHQLLWKRPDLRIVHLRGNVPTRLKKFEQHNDWAGIVLAHAGLVRLGLQVRSSLLSPADFLPAGGQGIVALQVRRDDNPGCRLLDAIKHEPTLLCLRAEREFLRRLNGDCNSPVGVWATIGEQELTLRAQVFEPRRRDPRMSQTRMSLRKWTPEEIAASLYSSMYEHP